MVFTNNASDSSAHIFGNLKGIPGHVGVTEVEILSRLAALEHSNQSLAFIYDVIVNEFHGKV